MRTLSQAAAILPALVRGRSGPRRPQPRSWTMHATGAMRILLLSYEFPPVGGGGAKVVAGLAAELAQQGHEVDVITMGWQGLPAEERLDGVRVTRLRTLRRRPDRTSILELGVWLLRAFPVVFWRLARNHYDAINAHFILPDGLICAVACALLGRRFVVTAHGSDVPGYNGDRFQIAHRLIGQLWRGLVKLPSCIVFPSPHLLELARQREASINGCVIPNGFHPGHRLGRTRQRRILVATRLFPRKGVQRLIEAYVRLDTDYELHVIGDGPIRQELEDQARTSGRPIVFHGWVENLSEEFVDLLESADIFAFPSESENFPVCLLEAMAFELAIVTTRDTGCEAVVGDAALLVASDDVDELTEALRRLTISPELRSRLGQRARQRLEKNFTWPAVASRYVEVYARHPASVSGRPVQIA